MLAPASNTQALFAVVDAAGDILWWGGCPANEVQEHARFGAAAVDITALDGWARNPKAFRYDHASQSMLPREPGGAGSNPPLDAA